jgi:hypothetical protein
MNDRSQQEKDQHPARGEESPRWETPKIIEEGRIEAKLFSDEPDPFDGP